MLRCCTLAMGRSKVPAIHPPARDDYIVYLVYDVSLNA